MINSLSLSKSIYYKKAIIKAVLDYKHLCKIKIIETDNYFICNFSNCKYDIKKTMLEFENYIIDIMNT